MGVFWKIVAAGLSAFLLWAAFPPMGEAVDIAFDVTVGQYGTSRVKTFNPAEYGVQPQY